MEDEKKVGNWNIWTFDDFRLIHILDFEDKHK